jgi:uncharacterized membrane protein YesL
MHIKKKLLIKEKSLKGKKENKMNAVGGFLGNDSFFGRIMTKCGTMIAHNVLFVLSCIPVVTIGAAQTAMYHSVFAMLNAEDGINPLKEYVKGFRKNVVRATLYWLAFAGIMVLGCIDLQACLCVYRCIFWIWIDCLYHRKDVDAAI